MTAPEPAVVGVNEDNNPPSCRVSAPRELTVGSPLTIQIFCAPSHLDRPKPPQTGSWMWLGSKGRRRYESEIEATYPRCARLRHGGWKIMFLAPQKPSPRLELLAILHLCFSLATGASDEQTIFLSPCLPRSRKEAIPSFCLFIPVGNLSVKLDFQPWCGKLQRHPPSPLRCATHRQLPTGAAPRRSRSVPPSQLHCSSRCLPYRPTAPQTDLTQASSSDLVPSKETHTPFVTCNPPQLTTVNCTVLSASSCQSTSQPRPASSDTTTWSWSTSSASPTPPQAIVTTAEVQLPSTPPSHIDIVSITNAKLTEWSKRKLSTLWRYLPPFPHGHARTTS